MTHKSTIATAIGLIMMASGPAYAEQIKTYPGQPLCSDQDGLFALIIAGIHGDRHAMNAVPGCQVIPAGSTAEVIERIPDSATVARLIVDLAKQSELDHSGHRPAVAKVLDLTEDWTERLYRAAAIDRGYQIGANE